MAAQLFFMIRGIENIPFFLYHMYSQQHPAKDSSAVYLIKTRDGYFDHKQLSNREQEILMNPVIYYVNLKKDGDGTFETVEKRFAKRVPATTLTYLKQQLGNDSISLAKFPSWWGTYFKSVSKINEDSVSVVKTYVYSKPPYRKSATDSLIFTLKLK